MPEDSADAFLRMIRRAQRGRLKIYLGYSAGVGKTYQMLQEGHRLRAEGIDVAIGLLETHGRADIARLAEGLEIIPRRALEYRGIRIEEMDPEAVIARRPQVALIDELAHTNVPGSRNAKRYEDIQDILDAGIHVISTLNVQHLESLYNIVETAVGVKVRERLPDSILAEADEIVDVDLATADLRKRLEDGKIYPADRIETAKAHFFTSSNLEKLRELALRELAAHIDLRRRETQGPEGGTASDQIMVCLSSHGPNSEKLLRYGSRLAGRFNRNWYAVYVQTPSEEATVIDAQAQRHLSDALTLAKQLGAMVFTYKGEDVVDANVSAAAAGGRAVAAATSEFRLAPPLHSNGKRWLITGNEAAGLGALRGGVRFAAAYPITPASEILEWLAPNLPKLGGTLVQAEDELASVNMIIGASYGGVPALTATSGPGLSLMIEALGLATAAEIPIVVIDVMRGGPSTGIPTKSEQTDLNIAVYGLHGEAPHLVIAPQSVTDCLLATQWATFLAEATQAPAIVLSDQSLGQTQAAVSRPADVSFIGQRVRAAEFSPSYKRYALGGSGISPMAIPGTPGGQYTADGLTHTERGIPTSSAREHGAQLDKRRDKIEGYAYGALWATLEGEGEVAVMTWGSLTGVAREAIARARADGHKVRLIAPRLLLPTRPVEMAAALNGVRRLLVVEQSHGAQFHRFLRAHYTLPQETSVLHRPGPLPIRPGEIYRQLTEGKLL